VTPFEVLEHTADVGVRATAGTLEGVFVEATRGLAEIAGIAGDERGERVGLELSGEDPAGLLVDWLSEVLWLHDSRDAFVGRIEVDEVSPHGVRGSVTLTPRGDRAAQGTQVKAVTYHRLHVGRENGGWTAEVYLDV